MESYKLVLPEHLNHYGFLFGGHLLKWVDEYAYITAAMEYPKHNFVTVGMDDVEFKESVRQGVILRFKVDQIKLGNTSVTYQVEVSDVSEGKEPSTIFKTNVTFVALSEEGEDGKPRAIDKSKS